MKPLLREISRSQFLIAAGAVLLTAVAEWYLVDYRPCPLFELVEDYLPRSCALQLLILAPLLLLPRRWAAWYGGVVIPLDLAAMIGQSILAGAFSLPVEKQLCSMISVSSSSEIREFIIGFFFGWMGVLTVAAAGALVCLGAVLFRLAEKPTRVTRIAGILLILPFLWLAQGYLRRGTPREILNTGTLFRMVLAWTDYRSQLVRWTEMAKSPRSPEGLHRSVSGDVAGVVVIGESVTKKHLAFYGYRRSTMPELEKHRDELVIFDDVWASDNHTAEALSWNFSFAVWSDPLRHPQISLCELLHRAGFRVVLLSNQDRWGEFDTPINLLFRSADRRIFLGEKPGSLRQDQELLPMLEEELKSSRQPVVIFLHLMQSHIPFRCRCLPGQEAFPEKGAVPELYRNAPETIRALVNQYDSAIRNSDDTVAGSLELLQKSGRPGFWLYFSDHGEAIYPGMERFLARDPEAAATYEVPMLVWLSPETRKARPEVMTAIGKNSTSPFQCDRLIYGILRLAGVEYDGFPVREDLFSPEFRPEKRHWKGRLLPGSGDPVSRH